MPVLVLNVSSASLRALMARAVFRNVQERSLAGSSSYGAAAYTGLQTVRVGSVEPSSVFLVRRLINPALVVLSLLCCSAIHGGSFTLIYIKLAVYSFVFSLWALEPPNLSRRCQGMSSLRLVLKQWALVVSLLLMLAFLTKASEDYSRRIVATWILLTPLWLLVADSLAWRIAGRIASAGMLRRTHIVVGVTSAGLELANRLGHNPYMGTFIGYFDDRNADRLEANVERRLLGSLADVPAYVRRNAINTIHISLPAISHQRVRELLDQLRDTTASIYFVPDIYGCDLMQGRMVSLDGLPLVALRETPFYGLDGVIKRASDMVLSLALLALLWPLLLLVGIAVKCGSRGPAVFKQRRYGLDGEEFWVYKFRTMHVCDDGRESLQQATQYDARVTRFGAFLRRFSLDELPQLFNVLEGTMSMVGPRPHAVAHNEQYRKLVPGYMLRHKVRPGITGWAQVNGFRGETDTLEKMEQRVAYDLDYLRNWSLWLDLTIVCMTAVKVLRDKQAY